MVYGNGGNYGILSKAESASCGRARVREGSNPSLSETPLLLFSTA
jgi:hypothetical protein